MEHEVPTQWYLILRFTATAANTRAVSQFVKEIMNIKSPFFLSASKINQIYFCGIDLFGGLL